MGNYLCDVLEICHMTKYEYRKLTRGTLRFILFEEKRRYLLLSLLEEEKRRYLLLSLS